MNELYNKVCFYASKKTTTSYSTSFSTGILLFDRNIRQDIYNIYGFVRFADEIVDTYEGEDKIELLANFRAETFDAINRRISFNPIIHSFQHTVNKHQIELDLISAFLKSMEMDLTKKNYDLQEFNNYVYGSAEVIGLMCLSVFIKDKTSYTELKSAAIALGSAFQKINFLRDIKSDFYDRGRVYFPAINFDKFTLFEKKEIEREIAKELELARNGIIMLPVSARYGVLLAYAYYKSLFNKIQNTSPSDLKDKRMRISNLSKFFIMLKILCRVSPR